MRMLAALAAVLSAIAISACAVSETMSDGDSAAPVSDNPPGGDQGDPRSDDGDSRSDPETPVDCAESNVLCVDDSPGATQEYATIQAAAAAARAGDTVVVHDGVYAGFTVTRSGNPGAPIRFRAIGRNVIIDRAGSSGDGIRIDNASYIEIEGFEIRNTASSPSQRMLRCISARNASANAPMRGNVLRRNRCIDADQEGIYVSQFSDGLIEDNEISGSGRVSGRSRSHGIYLANAGSDGTVIRGNRIYDNRNSESNGIHCNGDLSVGGDGLIRDIVITGNRIYANGQSGINLDGVQSARIENNVIYGNARHAIRGYSIDGAAGPRNIRILNNTLLASGGWAVKLSEDEGGHVIFNNVLSGTSGAISVGTSLLSSDNNVFLTNRLSLDDERSTLSLTEWRAATGGDARSVVASSNSVFVAPASNDFRLRPDSPARDAGAAALGGVNAPTVDVAGTKRPQGGAFDIGAYELVP